jgi:hypothetical protein
LYEIHSALADSKENKLDICAIVLPEYHQYLKIFEKDNADKLPPHCPSDHKVLLVQGFNPPFSPLHFLLHPDLQELKSWLDDHLSKGFIHACCSPATALILFVTEGDGLLRLVIDCCGINEGTIKNRYPLPLL